MTIAHADTIAGILADYRTVPMTEPQRALLRRLTGAARDHGKLVLPPFRVALFEPQWGEDHLANGYCFHSLYPAPVLVLLRHDLSPREVRRVYLHELRHCHDARDPDLLPVTRERWAREFEQVMAAWWQR